MTIQICPVEFATTINNSFDLPKYSEHQQTLVGMVFFHLSFYTINLPVLNLDLYSYGILTLHTIRTYSR